MSAAPSGGAAGLAERCDAGQAVLLVIDVQTRLTPTMPAKVLARLRRNLGTLLKSAGALEVPVLASEQYPRGLGTLEPEIMALLPEGTPRYEKTQFSLADVEVFRRDLAALGRRQVVLSGMEAHICVLQTALELQQAGYRVFVVADAVCSRHRECYETGLLRMGRAGVIICDTESVMFEWMRDARHPQFKTLQQLIR